MEDGVFHKERELEEQNIDTCLLVGRDHPGHQENRLGGEQER